MKQIFTTSAALRKQWYKCVA